MPRFAAIIRFAGFAVAHRLYGRRGRRREDGVRHFTGYVRLRGGSARPTKFSEVLASAPSRPGDHMGGGRRV